MSATSAEPGKTDVGVEEERGGSKAGIESLERELEKKSISGIFWLDPKNLPKILEFLFY